MSDVAQDTQAWASTVPSAHTHRPRDRQSSSVTSWKIWRRLFPSWLLPSLSLFFYLAFFPFSFSLFCPFTLSLPSVILFLCLTFSFSSSVPSSLFSRHSDSSRFLSFLTFPSLLSIDQLTSLLFPSSISLSPPLTRLGRRRRQVFPPHWLPSLIISFVSPPSFLLHLVVGHEHLISCTKHQAIGYGHVRVREAHSGRLIYRVSHCYCWKVTHLTH